jgi:hypothetical protein
MTVSGCGPVEAPYRQDQGSARRGPCHSAARSPPGGSVSLLREEGKCRSEDRSERRPKNRIPSGRQQTRSQAKHPLEKGPSPENDHDIEVSVFAFRYSMA